MSTARNDLPLPDDLVDLIKETARAQGRNPGEIVRDAVERYISDDRWQRVLAYGKRQARLYGGRRRAPDSRVPAGARPRLVVARRITADTNVYVSALNFGGVPEEIQTLARAGVSELAISDPILAEVERVLTLKFHWTSGPLTEAFLEISA